MLKGSVAVGCRLGAGPDPAFIVSWTNLIMHGLRDGDVVLKPSVGIPHSCACNMLVNRFLRTDCEWILFVDDDTSFKDGALSTLRDSVQDYGVLSAAVCCRRPPFLPNGLVKSSETESGYAAITPTSEPQEVDITGLAFTLIRRDVVETLASCEKDHQVFKWDNRIGEDGYFCLLAKENGFKVGIMAVEGLGHRVTFSAGWNPNTQGPEMNFETFGVGTD